MGSIGISPKFFNPPQTALPTYNRLVSNMFSYATELSFLRLTPEQQSPQGRDLKTHVISLS